VTIACNDCGTLQDLPSLQPGMAAICPTCAYPAQAKAMSRLLDRLADDIAMHVH
jgi:uncharacterized paraquat-inducible protein A